MELPADLKIIHQPVRLQLMKLLYQAGDIAAGAVREALPATPGNIDAHARRLQDAGMLEMRSALTRGGFESRFEITREGVARFDAYLSWLETFLASAR